MARPAASARALMPAVYINHGGGPLPLLGRQPHLAGFLSSYAATLAERPRCILVVTAHWEERCATVNTGAAPKLLFDYSGFPAESYEYQYPAPGSPEVAQRVQELLAAARGDVACDSTRAWDHGVFVPMMLMFPGADVPVVSLSLRADQDAGAHIAIGAALAPLRAEGVLIVGSGASYHNFGYFFADAEKKREGIRLSKVWDAWLRKVMTDPALPAARRREALVNWVENPAKHTAHPPGQAEHLMPLHVIAGCGGCEAARVVGDDKTAGFACSQFEYR